MIDTCEHCEYGKKRTAAAVEAERERWLTRVGFLLAANRSGEVVERGHCANCDEILDSIRARGESDE